MLKSVGMDGDPPAEAVEQMNKDVAEKTEQIMQALDADADGKITFEEFVKGAAVLENMQ